MNQYTKQAERQKLSERRSDVIDKKPYKKSHGKEWQLLDILKGLIYEKETGSFCSVLSQI